MGKRGEREREGGLHLGNEGAQFLGVGGAAGEDDDLEVHLRRNCGG